MGVIQIELLYDKNCWGIFTEEEKPRFILPLYLTRRGQVAECEEEELTPNQLATIETDHNRGVIKVTGASFLLKKKEKRATIQDRVFDVSAAEETDFQKQLREKMERVNNTKKGIDPTINKEELQSFLKKRQDKLIIQIKKNEKPRAFLKACRQEELNRTRPRKKVLEALEEAIQFRLANIQSDIEGDSELQKPSMLENEYMDLIEEKVLEKEEKAPQYSVQELEDMIKELKKREVL